MTVVTSQSPSHTVNALRFKVLRLRLYHLMSRYIWIYTRPTIIVINGGLFSASRSDRLA